MVRNYHIQNVGNRLLVLNVCHKFASHKFLSSFIYNNIFNIYVCLMYTFSERKSGNDQLGNVNSIVKIYVVILASLLDTKSSV